MAFNRSSRWTWLGERFFVDEEGRLVTAMRLEKTELKLGIIPLTDCAVIVVAKERGFFAKHGLDVTITKEASWANIRDKVIIGALDGAQMLAPMPIAATLGIGAPGAMRS